MNNDVVTALNNLPGFPPDEDFKLGDWLVAIAVRPAVADVASLPATGNQLGDARIVIAESTWYVWAGGSWVATGGGGGGAPVSAQYIVTSPNGALPNERVLAVAAGQLTQADGGAGGNVTLGLADTSVAPGTYGDATNVARVTVDAKGRVTAVTLVPVAAVGSVTASSPLASSGGSSPNITLDTTMGGALTGNYPNPGIANDAVGTAQVLNGAITSAKLSTTGVVAGAYGDASNVAQVTIDSKGRVTSATNVPIPPSVTDVTASAPLSSSGGQTPNITLDTVMGGALEGNYPNPTIGPEAVGTIQLVDNAVTSAKMSATGVVAGVYGDANNVAQVTVDSKGRLVSVVNVPVGGGGGGAITSITATDPLDAVTTGSTVNISMSVAMGGSLTGIYPNPEIAPSAVDTMQIANAAVTSEKLEITGVVADTYGTSTEIPVITVNPQGQITAASLVNVNFAGATVGGDLDGTVGAATVVGLQGVALSAAAPANGQILLYDGAEDEWVPTTSPFLPLDPDPTGTYGSATEIPIVTLDEYGRTTSVATTTIPMTGDVTGTPDANTVVALQGNAVASTAPSDAFALIWSAANNQWEPQAVVTPPLDPNPQGTFGSSTAIPVVTVNDKGYVTEASTVPVDVSGNAVGGDLSGTVGAATVIALQGNAVSSTAPANGQTMQWDGAAWSPVTPANLVPIIPDPAGTFGSATSIPTVTVDSFGRTTAISASPIDISNEPVGGQVTGTVSNITVPVGGDLTGPLSSASVTSLRGTAVAATAPTNGQILSYNGTAWAPTSVGTAAPIDAPYLVASIDPILTNQRTLSVTSDLTRSDSPTGVTLGLGNTTVTPDVYGQSNRIPVLTVNAQGRVVAGTEAILDISDRPIGGNVTGTISDTEVVALRDRPISGASPTDGQALVFGGGVWSPIFLNGDVFGQYGGNEVVGLRGLPVADIVPSTNQLLGWNGSAWAPTDSGNVFSGEASTATNAVVLFADTTGKVIKESLATINALGNIVTPGTISSGNITVGAISSGAITAGNITAGTYNGVTVTAHAARHAPSGVDALGTAAPTTGIGAANAEGTAETYARSDHNHALRTDSTDLSIGTVADGLYLKRVGTQIVGAAAAGAARTLTGNFVGPLTPVAANARWYPPAPSTVTRAWASLGEDATGVTEFDVLRNGASILPAPISISAGEYRSADVAVPSVSVLTTDYLTISLTTANGGANATVFIEYE
jgi:hypothetical protein